MVERLFHLSKRRGLAKVANTGFMQMSDAAMVLLGSSHDPENQFSLHGSANLLALTRRAEGKRSNMLLHCDVAAYMGTCYTEL